MFWLGLAIWNFSSSKRDSIDYCFMAFLSMLAVLMVGFSAWLLIRMPQAHPALGLEKSRIVSPKS